MQKRDLLIEIGLEEMPARFISDTINQFELKVSEWFKENRISFEKIRKYSSPRRLAILVDGVSDTQTDINEEAKGPAKKIALDVNGNWSKAAIGFTNGQGVSVENIYFKEINGIEYAHVQKHIEGRETVSLLPNLESVITSLYFPKNMRWADYDLKYIRPIKWLLALYGNEVIPFSIAHVNTSNHTYGHRFLGEKITIDLPNDYVQGLLSQFVIAEASERKSAILSQIENLMEEKDWNIPIDEQLLEEVNNLVEYPTVLFGRFEESFLQLPEQVLITSMKEHQRYFPVKSKEGELLPFFVTVRNGDHMNLETVAKGNEKVLRARLADASFFYNEDQKLTIDDCLKKLETIVYHEEIGTLSNKVSRVRELASQLSRLVSISEEEHSALSRAAQICKFDLVTNMVYEFPELQGLMGERYAKQKGEISLVAQAINEHYMPRNADDLTPPSQVGSILSIADKLDTIISFFSIGKIPSGSQDPYALRRQASGIVQIMNDRKWKTQLEDMIGISLGLLEKDSIGKRPIEEIKRDVVAFFKLRIKHLLQEKSVRYDIIEAVLGGRIGAVSSLISRAELLNKKKGDLDFKENMEALSRVLNLAEKATGIVQVNSSLFENTYEAELYNQIQALETNLDRETSEEFYYGLLIAMRPAITSFFDHTMVMSDNQSIRENRLSLLSKLARHIHNFAKVNEIIVK